MSTENKFTPGPWKVCNATDVFTSLGGKTSDGAESAPDDGWQIADCSVGVTYDKDGFELTLPMHEQQANAKLIAAAPELLKALEMWKRAQEYTMKYSHLPEAQDDIAQAWQDAEELRDKAIAKAKGLGQ